MYKLYHQKLVYYYNAADMLLMTSLSEGSPNVIKEAMACNCPIVSTKVGDVEEIVANTKNCYLSDWDPENISKLILKIYDNRDRTNGRNNILNLDYQH